MREFFHNYPKRKPKSKVVISSLWRDYIGYWKIKNRKLFLIDIKIYDPTGCVTSDSYLKMKSVYSQIFKKTNIFASFVTDLIIIPMGKMKQYVHMGYESKYERYKILEITKGTLTADEIIRKSNLMNSKTDNLRNLKKLKNIKS